MAWARSVVEFGPVVDRLQVLGRVALFVELEKVADLRYKCCPHFRRRCEEELPTPVGVVHGSGREVRVKLAFETDGVFREEQGVNVKSERHRSIAQFVNAIEGLKSSSQADLDNIVAERPPV